MSPVRAVSGKAEVIRVTSGGLAAMVADAWLKEIERANRGGHSHHVALSGGRIVQPLFASVVEQSTRLKISFGHVHFFWADERCVPPTDSESNFRVAQELLLGPLRISEMHIHRVPGETSPEQAAALSETELRRIVSVGESGQPELDLIFLGMGEDGHVASLFPGDTGSDDNGRVYRAVLNSPKPPPERVTLTYSILAAAKEVWVVASGKGKEGALQRSLSSGLLTPLGRVMGLRNHTKLFTDIDL
jgi:6-phosphogluconolactonase